MSTREAVLCDKKAPRGCDNMAVGKCPLCDNDVCALHALHPDQGGLRIEVKLTGINRDTKPPMDVPVSVVSKSAVICEECGKAAQMLIGEAASEVLDTVAVKLRAAFAMRAMADERDRR